MEYASISAAIFFSALEILAHHDIKDRLRKEYPEAAEKGLSPSNGFMIILLIAEIYFLISKIAGR